MSAHVGPEILNDNLVFKYDMANTQKSWKGAPTANRVVTIPYASTVYTACSGPVSTTVTDATGQSRTVNRYTITSTGGTPRARIVATGLTTGVNYTYSLKIKYNGSGAAQSYYIDSSKGNPETNNNSFTSRTITSTPIGNGWYQLVESFVFSACPTGGAWSNFGLSAPDASYLNQTFDAYDIQFEQQSFATPYVAGTRSNTQAIVDIAGNNTVTAVSLTYASNNTFSFDRTGNNTLLTSLPITFTPALSNFTYEVFLNITSLPPASNNGVILGATYYSGAAIYWRTNGSNFNIRGFIRGNDAYRITAEYTLALNTVYHVVMTNNYSAGTLNLYVNGVLFSSVATATQEYNANSATAGNIGVNKPQVDGGGSETYSYFTGRVDLAKIYTRALSANDVRQNFNAAKDRYLGESPDIPAVSGYALKQARPNLPSGYYWIKNHTMPNALRMYVDMTQEGGGYDFYPIAGTGINIGSVNLTHSGTALGLDLVYPRSKDHWIAMSNFVRNVLGDATNQYFTTVYPVHRTTSAGAGSRGGNYTGDIMRNPAFYGTGTPDWRVPDSGRWWLRDNTFSEPNGDYTAYNFLGGYTLPNPYTGQDLQFNDVTGQSYTTGGYYLVSTNAKP